MKRRSIFLIAVLVVAITASFAQQVQDKGPVARGTQPTSLSASQWAGRIQDGKIQLTPDEIASIHAKVDSIPDQGQKVLFQAYLNRVINASGQLDIVAAQSVVREIYDSLRLMPSIVPRQAQLDTTNWPPVTGIETQGTATVFTPTYMNTYGWTRLNGPAVTAAVGGNPSGVVGAFALAFVGGCTGEQMVTVGFNVGRQKTLSVQGTAITFGGTWAWGVGIASTEITCLVDYNDDLYFRQFLNEGLTLEWFINQLLNVILFSIGGFVDLPVSAPSLIQILSNANDVWSIIQGIYEMTQADSSTIEGSFVAQPGWHTVNVGVRSDAACFVFGDAYGGRVGGVTSILIDGIAKPNDAVVTGPTSGQTGTPYSFTATSTDPNSDQVKYYFDWGDNTNSGWSAYYSSGTPKTLSHTYSQTGYYQIAVITWDIDDMASDSSYHWIAIGLPPDVTPPNTSITSGPSGTITYNDVTFTWTGSDNVTPVDHLRYSFKLDGFDGSWSSWSMATSHTYNDLPDASYTFNVKARDESGNVDPTPAQRSFTVAVPPTLERALMCEWAGPEAFHHGPPIYDYALGDSCTCYCEVTHTYQGDIIRWEWKKDGSTWHTAQYTIPQTVTRVSCWDAWQPDQLGDWQVFIKCNGSSIGSAPVFTIHEPQLDWPMFRHDAAHTGYAGGVGAFALSEPVLKWRYQVSGFEVDLTSPVVGDVDNDGFLEVVVGSYRYGPNDGAIYCLDGCTGTEKWVFNCLPVQGTPALGDVDRDGNIEVVVGDKERLYCLQGSTGSVKWQLDYGSTSEQWRSPVLGNIDDDSDIEVVILNAYRQKVYAFNGANGNSEWIRNYDGGSQFGPPALGDVDGDGNVEVVFTAPTVICLDGATGTEEWRSGIGGDFGPVLIDVTHDDIPEVFGGGLSCLDGSTGLPIWSQSAGVNGLASVAAFDADHDGVVEIFTGNEGLVHCLNGETGAVEWTFQCSEPNIFHVDVCDVDADSLCEVTVNDWYHTYFLDAANGELQQTFDFSGPLGLYGEYIYADIDDDGKRELLYAIEHGISCRDGSDGIPPVAHGGGPYVNQPGVSIAFDGSGSYDLGGTITGYRWDWTNDGAWDTDWTTNSITQHTYDYAYYGTAKLQVRDAFGLTGEDLADVVGNAPVYEAWDKVLSAGSNNSDIGHAILQTPDGGYILTGMIDFDAFLTRVDQFGNQVWTRSFGQASWVEEGWSVDQTADQGFILAIHSLGSGNDDAWVIKTDSLGNEQWRRVFTEVSHDEWPFWVISCSDGGFALVGLYDHSLWLVKMNAGGNVVWNWTYGPGRGHCVLQTADGGFLVGGGFGSDYDGHSGILRVNASGTEQWRRTWPFRYFITDMEAMPDGGYVLSNWSEQYVDLIRINSSGDTLWTRELDCYQGGESLDRTHDGGFIVGASIMEGSNWKNWLFRTDSSGTLLWREIINESAAGGTYPPNLAVQETADSGYIVLNRKPVDGGTSRCIWLVKYQLDQNQAPIVPGGFYPPNGTVNTPSDTALCWASGDPDLADTVTYEIYFGSEQNPGYYASAGPYLATDTQISFDLSGLDFDSTYYWKICAHDNHSHTSEGPVCRFTVEERPIQYWGYRKTLHVSALVANYQMPLTVFKEDGHDNVTTGTVDCENHCNTNFSDLIFLDAASGEVLPFWIEETDMIGEHHYARLWVRTAGTDSLYMCYGNASATTASDAASTFSYFDHWTTDNTANWIHGVPVTNMHHWWENTKTFYAGRALESRSKLVSWNAGTYDFTELGWTADRSSFYRYAAYVSVKWSMRTDEGASNSIVRINLNVKNGTQTTSTSFVSVPKPDASHVLSLSLMYDSTQAAYEWKDLTTGSTLASGQITDPSAIPPPVTVPYLFHVEYDAFGGIHSWLSPSELKWGNEPGNGGCEWHTDYWFVRKHTSPEPTWISFGSEEVPAVASITDLCIFVSGNDVVLSWSYNGDVVFNVYGDTTADGAFSNLVASTPDTTVTLPGAIATAEKVFYVVRASVDSGPLTVTPGGSKPLQNAARSANRSNDKASHVDRAVRSHR